MNREEFISYVKKPASLDKRSLPEINELIEEYPFFQSGQLLFLKNLHNLDHIRFGSQLKKSSSIVSNRECLYELIFPAAVMDTEISVESEPEVKDSGSVSIEAGQTPVAEKPEEEKYPEETQKPDSHTNLKGGMEEKQEVPIEVSPIQEDIDHGEGKSTNDLREQIERRLAEIRGEDYQEVKAKISVEKEKIQEKESIVDSESHTDNQNIIEEKEAAREENLSESGELFLLGDEKEVEDLSADTECQPDKDGQEILSEEEPLLDLSYPLQNEDSKNEEIVTEDQDGEESISSGADMESDNDSGDFKDENGLKQEIHSFESWLSMLGTGHSEEDTAEMKKSVSGQREIIDKFILTNPRIQPRHADHYEKGDMAAESVRYKDGLFTETLANIYIKQGYYSKAIFFYQELSLKFPEKSAYFAGQIKEIEKRINKL